VAEDVGETDGLTDGVGVGTGIGPTPTVDPSASRKMVTFFPLAPDANVELRL